MATADVSNCDEEHKPEKTVYKRRSSIFHTQSITCDEASAGAGEIINGKRKFTPEENKGDLNVQNDVDTFNLKEYTKKLKDERTNWQEEYRRRKIERRDLAKEKASMEEEGQTLDINILSESERTFLLKRPNYEYFCKNNQKLLDVALKISMLNQLVRKLNQRFMEKMEDNISQSTRSIIEMSER
ncbi:hypothetical protein DMN91_005698 [Ooceraea biroi]|uniref:Uncharacterized protein n=1 Tax=Ooceraea biroi TaxID=2015173 RepID=A0A026W1E8_OOCBI|nr:uncharacterized protein LOC105285130 [Ooceraea biroi]EZA48884.1 hypothetical protein X777_12926 [Ooceraea biroi]RLU21325.1 hypothetical protein DMN91_005698 [Ooceraea biroi]